MLGYAGARDATRREIDAMTARVETLDDDDFSKPTRCADWTVAHLVAHVAAVADAQGEAFERAMVGDQEQPSFADAEPDDPGSMKARMRAGRDRLVAGMEAVGEGDAIVPLPFAPLPPSIAIYIPLIEHAFHRNDLEWALGNLDPLPTDVATTLLATLPGFLPTLETAPADAPVAYTLDAPSGSVTFVFRDGTWSVAEAEDTPCCVIRGDDSAVALFALGRIDAAHPWIKVEGDVAAAARFKHHFPGP